MSFSLITTNRQQRCALLHLHFNIVLSYLKQKSFIMFLLAASVASHTQQPNLFLDR